MAFTLVQGWAVFGILWWEKRKYFEIRAWPKMGDYTLTVSTNGINRYIGRYMTLAEAERAVPFKPQHTMRFEQAMFDVQEMINREQEIETAKLRMMLGDDC